MGKIGKIISPKIAGDFWVYWKARWIDPSLPKNIDRRQPTVVMTVAHGDGFMAAQRFAQRHSLPLVSFFQDWWPDMAEAHAWAKPVLDKQFRNLAGKSTAAICVSDGMKQALGHPSCVVLPPIAAKARRTTFSSASESPIKIIYFGNLAEYGPMLAEALGASLDKPSINLVVRGGEPRWPRDLVEAMRRSGNFLEFAPRSELGAWLDSADAFLVPMVFDSGMRRRMETSFPSKLVEFAQLGKPLVIWGPEYCTAVAWGRRTGAALCVTDPDAKALVSALDKMAKSAAERSALAVAAQKAAANELDPVKIQQDFRSILEEIFAK